MTDDGKCFYEWSFLGWFVLPYLSMIWKCID